MAVTLIFLTGCSSLLYYPTRTLYVDTKKLERAPQEHKIVSEDGEQIVLWHFSPKDPADSKGLIVFFHGNGQNLSAHFYYLYWILEQKYEFVIFDYPGYGISSGTPSPANTVTSGKAVMRWAKAQRPNLPISVFGQSLGGAVALRTAVEVKTEIPIRTIILDSTFQSYQRAGQTVLAKSWVTWLFQPLSYILLSDTYAPKGQLQKLNGISFLVLHGDKDDVINIELGEELFKDLPGPKEFIKIPGAAHTQALVGSDPREVRSQFLRALEK